MKTMLKTMMALTLAVLMLASSVGAYAAAPAKTETEVTELNWEDCEDALKEAGIEGDFYVLNAVAAQFWVPSVFSQTEVSDEDAEKGLIAYFDDGEGEYGFFVTYVDGKGATLDDYAKDIAEDEDYTDLEYLSINGLDAIGFIEEDKDMDATFLYVSFVTESGYILTFTYWDVADEDYAEVAMAMVSSIQPEEE